MSVLQASAAHGPQTSLGRVYRWMLPILLFAATITIYNLDKSPLYTDEIRSVEHLGGVYGQNTIPQIIASIETLSPQHSPGYFILLRFWADIMGFTPFALRFLAVMAGVIGLTAFYRLARELLGQTAGLWAAALLGSMPLGLFYMDEIRMYPLALALIIFDMWWYSRLIQPRVRVTHRRWVIFFLINLLALYVHYMTIIPIAALGIYHLVVIRKNRRWWLITGAMAAAGVCFLPWLQVVIRGMETNQVNEGFVRTGWDALRLIIQQSSNQQIGLFVILALLALIGWRRHPKVGRFIWLQALAVLAITLGLLVISPFLTVDRSGRYITLFYPALLLLVVLGLMQLRGQYRELRVVAFGIWVAGAVVFAQSDEFGLYTNRATRDFDLNPPLPQITHELMGSGRMDAEDLLIVPSIQTRLKGTERLGNYYFQLLGLTGHTVNPQGIERHASEYERVRATLNDLSPYRVIWLGYDPRQIDTPELKLMNYGRLPFGCMFTDRHNAPPRITFTDEAITLDQVLWVQVDRALQIALSWSTGDSVPAEKYSFSLVLFDPDGQVMAQADQGLGHGTRVWQYATIDTGGWPAGDYVLKTTVYDWRTVQRLMNAGDLPSDNGLFTLGSFTLGSR